jgi:DNA repair photolyase
MKDPAQRKACGCVVSRDIGMYESCPFGCRYCYATRSFDQARANFGSHDPESPLLLGWHEPPR